MDRPSVGGHRSRVAAVDVGQLVGARVRALRKQRKLSIEALAARAELDPSYVSNVERGVQNPSLATIAQLATALGVDLPEVVDIGPRVEAAALRKQLAQRIQKLSADQLRALLRWLDAFGS